jgi:hypothetical protein
MKTNIKPLILYHEGNSEYLRICIKQALKYNKRVILLGDQSNASIPDIEHFIASDFEDEYLERLMGAYDHMDSNPKAIGLIWLKRWFLMLNFIKKHQIETFFYIDSDILLFKNINDVIDSYPDYKAGLIVPEEEPFFWVTSGHSSFWRKNFLELFCAFVLDIYENRKEILLKKWEWHRANNVLGGICDMTLIYLFYKEHEQAVVNLTVVENNACFDLNINVPDNAFKNEYEMTTLPYPFSEGVGEVKSFYFRGGIPYAYSKVKKREIKFFTLHCQGKAKNTMSFFLQSEIPGARFQTLSEIYFKSYAKRIKDSIKYRSGIVLSRFVSKK